MDRVALAASQSLCLKAVSSFSSVVGSGYLLIGLKLREATLLPCLVPVTEAEHGSKCLLKFPSHRWWLWCLSSGSVAMAGLTNAGIVSQSHPK